LLPSLSETTETYLPPFNEREILTRAQFYMKTGKKTTKWSENYQMKGISAFTRFLYLGYSFGKVFVISVSSFFILVRKTINTKKKIINIVRD
jgi:hypothetical protein